MVPVPNQRMRLAHRREEGGGRDRRVGKDLAWGASLGRVEITKGRDYILRTFNVPPFPPVADRERCQAAASSDAQLTAPLNAYSRDATRGHAFVRS